MQELKNYIKEIKNCSKSSKIYLVGGLIRDILLKRERDVLDCDLVIEGEVLGLVKEFAPRIGGSWFILDEKNQIYRVVRKDDPRWRFDISSLKGGDIISDLKSRDYTINALALEIEEGGDLNFKDLIDPCSGKEDLRKKIIRVIAEDNLISDPVRILRGVALASELGFEIERETLEFLKNHASLLDSEAGERISEELFKILRNNHSYKFFILMNDLRILDYLFRGWGELRFPYPGPYHHLPIDVHSIESLKQLESLLEELQGWEEIWEYLTQEVRGHRRRLEILKLATLFHDLGKAPTYIIDQQGRVKFTGHEKIGRELVNEISFRLKLSRRETQMLADMVYYHLRPGFLVDCIKDSKRALFRYFRDTGEEALAIILLSIADKEATRGELSVEGDIRYHKKVLLDLIKGYFRKREEVQPPRLVTGWDVMKILNISSGPVVGRILREVEEAQAEKKIITREDALKYIKTVYKRVKGEY